MSAQQRLTQLSGQLNGAGGKSAILAKNPNDIVITYATRSALTHFKKGAFKDTKLEDLLIPILTAVREKSNISPDLVEEIVVGNVLEPNANYISRGALLAAGFPPTTASSIASRWCSSGLLATQSVANQILTGVIDIGIAVGAESMSQNKDNGAPPLGPKIMNDPNGKDLKMPMGWTAENLAGDYGIARDVQDDWAAESTQKAERAQKEGWPKDEITPITVQVKDPKTGEVKTVVADRDDGVRYGTTKEGLAKLRQAFPQWEPATTTGGNASQITDGVAALLMMTRAKAQELGQPILAKYVGSTVAGLAPRIMGAGPTVAVPKLLKKFGVNKEDVDIWEINEAFGSVLVHCAQTLGVDRAKVNPRGGAIALGHPLGCTGARQIVTAISELKRQNKKIAVTTMCVGTGMGMAGLIVSEQ
ncbi:3-ketoacyl-CoA thiolase [Microthyrium microscopicum]|uniref:acetyl-CoA C-acyltransferase n=1 Tax=Microthyrium microscopicum TaxID=703497 RepID=A0A6A6U1J2_9PEZI|nr:3-ketoacyl-CoA thiolase [Microthyrium microscopicum]